MTVPSTEEIYNANQDIIATQTALANLVPQADTAQQLLADVSTPSDVAAHRLWNYVFSFLSRMVRLNFEEHKTEVNVIASEAPYGTPRWWVKILKTFQYGTALTFVEDKIAYAVIDTSLCVVKRAACVVANNGVVFLKVAAEAAGEPVELPAPQFNALAGFVRQMQPAGVRIQLVTADPDFFRIFGTAYCDPLVINIADGSLISDPSVFPLEDAVNNYLAAIPFNGVLNITHLIDAIQAAEGIRDFVPGNAQYQLGIAGWNTFVRQYSTFSGSVRLSTTVGDRIQDTVIYSAD